MYDNTAQKHGTIYGISAFVFWGLMPIYFKSVSTVPTLELVGHRIIWSFIFMALFIWATGALSQLADVIRSPRQLIVLFTTALLIGSNWLVFIWAVNNNHLLDASLGYFINPLFSMLLGYLFLGERLKPFQTLAVVLVVLGCLYEVVNFGALPWVALYLAMSAGLYGLLRKQLKIDSGSGIFVETILMLPVAIVYLLFLSESASWSSSNWQLNGLLILSGPLTLIPLMFFTAAVVRIPLTNLAFFQYIGPSLMLVIAVAFYSEQFPPDKAVTFGFIWAGLVFFTLNSILQAQRKPGRV